MSQQLLFLHLKFCRVAAFSESRLRRRSLLGRTFPGLWKPSFKIHQSRFFNIFGIQNGNEDFFIQTKSASLRVRLATLQLCCRKYRGFFHKRLKAKAYFCYIVMVGEKTGGSKRASYVFFLFPSYPLSSCRAFLPLISVPTGFSWLRGLVTRWA